MTPEPPEISGPPSGGAGSFSGQTVTLAHGGGGTAMRELIESMFVAPFSNPELCLMEDQARLDLADLLRLGDRLAFTTDSFVVDPLFFPGGDIGLLAVNGTVNDLAVGGARPRFLSCGFILEEGLALDTLRRVVLSMQAAARDVGVEIVTGDTKVVPRGAADKLFINTAGIGVIPEGVRISARSAQAGDRVLVNGTLGDHGAAILQARAELLLESPVRSDCRPLHRLVQAMLEACPEVHCLRDATRGGVAAVLNELAGQSGVGIEIEEKHLGVREEVRGLCELLGLDPLYLASEGLLVAVVPAAHADKVLAAMRALPEGADAALIGRVTEVPRGRVILKTGFGGDRIVDTLAGEQWPRIC